MEDYNVMEDDEKSKKSIKGYRTFIILLVVVLIGLSFIYFRQMSQLRKEYQVEKDTLTLRISNLITDLDNIHSENAAINVNLSKERVRADSLMDKLKGERNLTLTKVRKYEQELGTMRAIMRRYVFQIDSLNKLNRALTAENVEVRQQATDEKQRADAAEERATELSKIVQTGAVVKARDIAIVALNSNDRTVTRARRAVRLRVDFMLASNDIASAGVRDVYACITGPDGYVMTGDTDSLFDFGGNKTVYSAKREVEYQNEDLDVSIYYNGPGIVSGTYVVTLYMDGVMIGTAETMLK